MWFAVCILLCVVLLAQGQMFLHCQTCIRSNKAINGSGQLGEVLILWESLLPFSLLFIWKSFYWCIPATTPVIVSRRELFRPKGSIVHVCLQSRDLACFCSIASGLTNHKPHLGIAPSIALFTGDYHFNLFILICICFLHANVLLFWFFFFFSAIKLKPNEGDTYYDVVAVVDPVTREAQRLAPLLLVGLLWRWFLCLMK